MRPCLCCLALQGTLRLMSHGYDTPRYFQPLPFPFLSPLSIFSASSRFTYMWVPSVSFPAWAFRYITFVTYWDFYLFYFMFLQVYWAESDTKIASQGFLFSFFFYLFHVDSCQYLRGGFPQIPSLFLDKVSICIRLRRRNGPGHKYN